MTIGMYLVIDKGVALSGRRGMGGCYPGRCPGLGDC